MCDFSELVNPHRLQKGDPFDIESTVTESLYFAKSGSKNIDKTIDPDKEKKLVPNKKKFVSARIDVEYEYDMYDNNIIIRHVDNGRNEIKYSTLVYKYVEETLESELEEKIIEKRFSCTIDFDHKKIKV